MGIAIALGATVISVGAMGLHAFKLWLRYLPQRTNAEVEQKYAELLTSHKQLDARLARLEQAAGLTGMRR